MRIATKLSGMTGFLTAVWSWPGVSVAAKLLLPMVPLGAALAFILSGPHRGRCSNGGGPVCRWSFVGVLGVIRRLERVDAIRFGLHAAAAVTGGGIFREYCSWRATQLPGIPVRAAPQFPWLLAGHVEWLQFHFDSLAGPVPMAAPAVGGLGGCFALAQAGRLFRCLQGDETGRKRAKSSLCGAARFMPPEKVRKLSGAPGRLILGAESQSPTSRLVSNPLARAARTLAPPRSGKTRDGCAQSAAPRRSRLRRAHDRCRSAGRALVRDGAATDGAGPSCPSS